jgi:hypothetical protein
MAGTSLYALMELGGWAKVESVMVYAHLSAEQLRVSSNRIGALRTRVWVVAGHDLGTPASETKKAPTDGASAHLIQQVQQAFGERETRLELATPTLIETDAQRDGDRDAAQ